MTTEYFPFDAGAGASVAEAQWRKMARHWVPTGVLAGEADELVVSERAAGAAMSVDVAAGEAWLRGHFFASDAVETLPIAAADPTDDRIDRIVLRADFVVNTITLEVLEGTPDPAPTAPALTQTSGRWEISLAQVLVEAAAVSILDAAISDERTYGNTDEIAYAERTMPLNVTATTEGTADEVVAIPETYFDGSPVMIKVFSPFVAVAAAGGGGVVPVLYEDGAFIGRFGTWNLDAAGRNTPATLSVRRSPAEGLHTYSWRAIGLDSAGAVIGAGDGSGAPGAYFPAYIRITRV